MFRKGGANWELNNYITFSLDITNTRFSYCKERNNSLQLFFLPVFACCFLQEALLDPCIYYLSAGKYLMLETFVNVCGWLNRIDY